MNLKDQLDALLDATAFDSTGAKVGAVRQIYVDDASGKATFATVATGIFSADAIVPLHGARLLDDELHVDHTRAVIRDSPRPDNTEDALTPEQEVKLLEYYGIETPTRLRGAAAPGSGTVAGGAAAGAGTPPSEGRTAAGAEAKRAGTSEDRDKADSSGEPNGSGTARTEGESPSGSRTAAGAEAKRAGTSPSTTPRPTTPPAPTGTTMPEGAAPEGAAPERAASKSAAPTAGRRSGTTTSSAAPSASTDTPDPAKASGPGPAKPSGAPSDGEPGEGENPARD